MKFGSLFAGIGGFDLGLERSGMTCQWQVEIDDYPQRYWKNIGRRYIVKETSKNAGIQP